MIASVTEMQELLAKSYQDRGITAGPGEGTDPGHPGPEDYDRLYISGHGAGSPQAGPPRANPVPAREPGRVQPVAMPGAPYPVAQVVLPSNAMAMTVPARITQSLSLGSPSER